MRLEAVKREVNSTGVMQVAKATIKATPKLFDMFADQTYQNKPEAITRELVANGIDAHIAAGIPNEPVTVTLPTELDPVFKVKDHGIGMSKLFLLGDPDNGIESQFMAYTDGSTKDQSDTQIGGFGIGSKSPFADNDQFTIRSVKDGVLVVCSVFKDEDGIPAIGLLGERTTDEPNGVEVSFPVPDEKQAAYREAAQNALQYFNPLPVVINGTINPPEYTYVGNGWALRPQAGSLGCIVGGIRYPVTTASLGWALRSDTRLAPLLEYGIDLTMPMGSVGIAMSREGLSYTERTTKGIEKRLNEVVTDVIATFSNMFDTAPSLWDARILLGKEVGLNNYSTTARQKLLAANARYKGAKLETRMEVTQPYGFADVWVIESAMSRRGRTSLTKPTWDDIAKVRVFYPGSFETVFIDDMPVSPKSKVAAKVREYVEGKPRSNQSMVIRPSNGRKVKDIVDAFEGITNYVLVSSLPDPVVVAKAKNVRPKVRMFTFTGDRKDRWTNHRIKNLSKGGSKDHSVKEVAYADQPASGIMCVMENFDLPDLHNEKLDLGLIKPEDVYYVNRIDADKIKSTFKNFNDEFDRLLKIEVAKYPDLGERLRLDADGHLSSYFEMCKLNFEFRVENMTDAQRKRPFGRIAELFKKYVEPVTTDQRKLAPFIKAEFPKGINPSEMDQAVKNKQPLLAYLLDTWSYDPTNRWSKEGLDKRIAITLNYL